MKNKRNMKIGILAVILVASFLLQACSSANQTETAEMRIIDTADQSEDPADDENETEETYETTVIEESSTDNSETSQIDSIETISKENDLTADEIAGLIYMREEEKLAKDVYLGLYDIWGISIFQNIANSEQTHTDAVKQLLDMFGIEDPADTSPTGIFANEELQNLYDELMSLGSKSLSDALMVGGAIEEIDILDLQAYLENTQNEDIQRVYENLLRGSENHLRAFTSNFERQTGETYQPQYLSQADYTAIIESGSSRGGRGNANQP